MRALRQQLVCPVALLLIHASTTTTILFCPCDWVSSRTKSAPEEEDPLAGNEMHEDRGCSQWRKQPRSPCSKASGHGSAFGGLWTSRPDGATTTTSVRTAY